MSDSKATTTAAPEVEGLEPVAKEWAAPWAPISTLPHCDDEIWLGKGDTIDGPRPPEPDDVDYWDWWCYAEAPPTRRSASKPVPDELERFDFGGRLDRPMAVYKSGSGYWTPHDQAAALLQSRDATIEGLRAELAEAKRESDEAINRNAEAIGRTMYEWEQKVVKLEAALAKRQGG